MTPTNFSGMPDTTTPKNRIGRGWYAIRLFALVITPLALGLTLFAPMLKAQDSGDPGSESQILYAQSDFDDDQTTNDDQDTDNDQDMDGRVAEDQYDTEDGDEDTQGLVDSNGQPLSQNPNTGGPALLPIVGMVGVAAWSAVGFSLLPRRNKRA